MVYNTKDDPFGQEFDEVVKTIADYNRQSDAKNNAANYDATREETTRISKELDGALVGEGHKQIIASRSTTPDMMQGRKDGTGAVVSTRRDDTFNNSQDVEQQYKEDLAQLTQRGLSLGAAKELLDANNGDIAAVSQDEIDQKIAEEAKEAQALKDAAMAVGGGVIALAAVGAGAGLAGASLGAIGDQGANHNFYADQGSSIVGDLSLMPRTYDPRGSAV